MWSPCVSILVTIESILYLLDINPLSVNTVVLNKFEELWVHSGIRSTVISISSCIRRMSIKCEELKTFISKWMLYSRVWKSSDDFKMLGMILAFNAFLTKNRIFAAAYNFSLQRRMWHSNSWGNYWSAYPSFKRSRLQNWNLKLTNLDGFSNFSNARWLGCIPKLKRTRYKLRDSANVFFNTCQLSKAD